VQLTDLIAVYNPKVILPLAIGVPAFLFLFYVVTSIKKLRNYLKKITQQQNESRNVIRAYLIIVSFLVFTIPLMILCLAIFPWQTAIFLSFFFYPEQSKISKTHWLCKENFR